MKSLKERTEIQQAFLNGADVECCIIGNNSYGPLDHCSEPDFNWMINDFRIKPKPMEVWVNVYDVGMSCPRKNCLHDNYMDAKHALCTDGRTVKFIEAPE